MQPMPLTCRNNEHHTLPRSCGGSDNTFNVTKMDRERHAEFHDTFAGNRTPLTLTRLIALHSIGYRGVMLHPDQLEDLFAETTVPRWHRLYEDKAVANHWRPEMRAQRVRANSFAVAHAHEELDTVDEALGSLNNGSPLLWQRSTFLPSVLEFFDATAPSFAVQRMYAELSNGQLAWTKCLQADVREGVRSLFVHRKVPFDRGCKRDLRIVLSQQRDRLDRCISRWERDAELAAA